MPVVTGKALACAVSAYIAYSQVEDSNLVEECVAMYHSIKDQVKQDPDVLAVELDLANDSAIPDLEASLTGSELIELIESLAQLITRLHHEPSYAVAM